MFIICRTILCSVITLRHGHFLSAKILRRTAAPFLFFFGFVFFVASHPLLSILPGFYPAIDFIHQFRARLSKHHLRVFLLIHITQQLISLATPQTDRQCKHLLYWFCIQPERLARPTESNEIARGTVLYVQI